MNNNSPLCACPACSSGRGPNSVLCDAHWRQLSSALRERLHQSVRAFAVDPEINFDAYCESRMAAIVYLTVAARQGSHGA